MNFNWFHKGLLVVLLAVGIFGYENCSEQKDGVSNKNKETSELMSLSEDGPDREPSEDNSNDVEVDPPMGSAGEFVNPVEPSSGFVNLLEPVEGERPDEAGADIYHCGASFTYPRRDAIFKAVNVFNKAHGWRQTYSGSTNTYSTMHLYNVGGTAMKARFIAECKSLALAKFKQACSVIPYSFTLVLSAPQLRGTVKFGGNTITTGGRVGCDDKGHCGMLFRFTPRPKPGNQAGLLTCGDQKSLDKIADLFSEASIPRN